jgi:hypothetical protein
MKKATFYIAFSIGAPMCITIYFQIKKTKRGIGKEFNLKLEKKSDFFSNISRKYYYL